MVKRRHAHDRSLTPSQSIATKCHGSVFASPLLNSACFHIVPSLLVIVVAVTAVMLDLTTSTFYVQSSKLQILLKRSFIVWICLTVRTQLTDFVTPPQLARRRQSLKTEVVRHTRALFAVVAANLLGTTIIRPVFGAAPQFEETVKLVIPIYVLVVAVVDGFHVPLPLLKATVGLSVSWLKAVTIPKLIREWKVQTSGHPLGFLAISTANLYASGVVLRYLTNYSRSNHVVQLSIGTFKFILQSAVTSATVGILAYLANHFITDDRRILEARFLYFCVTCDLDLEGERYGLQTSINS
ncbi:uncharacterized protein PHALS_04926 [Plasmopara halstedii]|uniref:Uncharacterized protein n=1 Tax=Plasmopara halstedii TaxID=4781 RepID=A0A0P1A9W6_PLAHL|nr:uncharacterized protein PHALS_04926 [Plasmopara halstedii]CEG37326.1 hypothetical protein PHALS_04926 [Plasmopara halstedii]|eukprot:XP_024573695.1 hypothetical protein PHALS_04926 [Plasmopara halstedii]